MKPKDNVTDRLARGTWARFFAWALFGLIAGFGLLILGTLAAVVILVAVVLAATRPTLRRSWFGALTGVGAVSLTVAFAQRQGPGTICWHAATAAGCDQYLNPWPWFIVGAALVGAGFAAQVAHMRSR
jgi:hypothetical protein